MIFKLATAAAVFVILAGGAAQAEIIHFGAKLTGSGANAPPVVVVTDPRTPIGSSVILTQAQQDDLLAGKWYFNVHTAANPGGEIRGQVQRLN